MSVWDDADLGRWAEQVEERFAAEYKCIEKRAAIAIVSGTSVYTVGTDLLYIRRITYNGRRLSPLPQTQQRQMFQGYVMTGTPRWYIYNDLIPQRQIRLFPTPNVTITASGNLYGSGLRTGCVMSYWSRPDFNTYTIPAWFRLRVIKAGVMALAFQQEGRGQNLKAAQYWDNKFVTLANRCGVQMNSLMTEARRLVMNGCYAQYSRWPASPVLPIDKFGV